MKRAVFFAIAWIWAAQAMPLHAQPTRVFVAAQGSDGNPCTFAQPCRTFQHAHDVVTAGGEIDVLDPAGYGALTITKAITIQGHDFSGISVSGSSNAITINAGQFDVIDLRGLIIEGVNGGDNGIRFNTGAALTIESCVIRTMTLSGIAFLPSTSSRLTVSNSVISANGFGINVTPGGSATALALVSRSDLTQNQTGIYTFQLGTTGVGGVVADSVVAHNSSVGIDVSSDLVPTYVTVRNSTVAYNGTGVYATGPGAIMLTQTTVTGNTVGWGTFNFGQVQSYGDNTINANVMGDPAPPLILKK